MVTFSKVDSQDELNTLIKEERVKKLWTNVWIAGKRHEVYAIEGKTHGISGRHGENNLWAHPVDVTLHYLCLTRFDGEPVCWGIRSESLNVFKEYWGGPRMAINKTTVWITLNNHDLYPVNGDLNYATHKAFTLISELKENPLFEFGQYQWRSLVAGRQFLYKDEPATAIGIEGYLSVSAKLNRDNTNIVVDPFDRNAVWSIPPKELNVL